MAIMPSAASLMHQKWTSGQNCKRKSVHNAP